MSCRPPQIDGPEQTSFFFPLELATYRTSTRSTTYVNAGEGTQRMSMTHAPYVLQHWLAVPDPNESIPMHYSNFFLSNHGNPLTN